MDAFGKMLDPHTLQFVRLLPGPIERVWSFIADGKKRGEWFAAGDLPAKVGEEFHMHFKHADYSPHKSPPPAGLEEMDCKGHDSSNVLLAFEPPHRLVFTFGAEKLGKISEVEFLLRAEGDKVRLTLTHRKIPDADFAGQVTGGWHAHLAVLEDKLNGRVPPSFWDIWREMKKAYAERQA